MDMREILITIVVGTISVAVSFYLKDFLMQKAQYRKLRKKLERIAGKNAAIIYDEGEIVKIKEIDENGVTLESELKTIFIPTAMLLQTEMVLPSTSYAKIIEEKKEKEQQRMARLLVEEFTKSMVPTMMGPMREDSKETREALVRVLTSLESKTKKDSLQELLPLLMKTGVLEPPDPVQLVALRFAQLLQGGETTPGESKDTEEES
jgi:putative effector of murein hydrolase LrgA (UPF0299 family)